MIVHASTVFCTKCVIDPDTNNATLVEVLDQINIPEGTAFPMVAPIQSDLVSVWYRSNPNEPGRGTGRVSLVRPNGEKIVQKEYAIDLSVFYRGRTITRSGGFNVLEFGVYYFWIDVRQEGSEEWDNVAKIPVSVASIPAVVP
jgi:hypothetical protein